MTKKDYIAIAAAIKQGVESSKRYAANGERVDEVRLIAERISRVMAEDNSRFDADKFITACGV